MPIHYDTIEDIQKQNLFFYSPTCLIQIANRLLLNHIKIMHIKIIQIKSHGFIIYK